MKKDNDEERSLPYRCYLLIAIAVAIVGKNHLLQRSIFIVQIFFLKNKCLKSIQSLTP